MIKRTIACWWRGHDVMVPPGSGCEWFCEHCGRWIDYHTVVTKDGGMVARLRELRKRWAVWWMPCEDCGKRFGRHGETQDHVPF